MQTVDLRCVTIIAEAVLERRLIDDVRECGAKGYTITAARGEGSRGRRTSDWEVQNIEIRTIVSPAVADAILERLATNYFHHFAIIAYVQTVGVVRGEKYI
jgi:nitrogen regulatory protein P-II 2